MLNGAYFTPSGAGAASSYSRASSLGAKSSSMVGSITSGAGALSCHTGTECQPQLKKEHSTSRPCDPYFTKPCHTGQLPKIFSTSAGFYYIFFSGYGSVVLPQLLLLLLLPFFLLSHIMSSCLLVFFLVILAVLAHCVYQKKNSRWFIEINLNL